jgi:hypothetical protein
VIIDGSRGDLDRVILSQQIEPLVLAGKDETDRLIRYAITLVEAHDQLSGCLEAEFRSLMWALTRRGGCSTIDDLLGDSAFVSSLVSTRRKLTRAAERFQVMFGLRTTPKCLMP